MKQERERNQKDIRMLGKGWEKENFRVAASEKKLLNRGF